MLRQYVVGWFDTRFILTRLTKEVVFTTIRKLHLIDETVKHLEIVITPTLKLSFTIPQLMWITTPF